MIALAILALLVFGPEGMPGVIKKVVRTVRALRTAAADFQTEIKNALEEESNRLEEEKRRAKLPETAVEDTVLAQAGESVPAESAEVATSEGDSAPSEATEMAVVDGEPEAIKNSQAEAVIGEETSAGIKAQDGPVAQAGPDIDLAAAGAEPPSEVSADNPEPTPELATDASVSDEAPAVEATAEEPAEEPEPEDDDGPGIPMQKPMRSVEA